MIETTKIYSIYIEKTKVCDISKTTDEDGILYGYQVKNFKDTVVDLEELNSIVKDFHKIIKQE